MLGAWAPTLGIPDGGVQAVVESGPVAPLIAAEWMSEGKAKELGLEGSSVVLLLKPQIIILGEQQERVQ